MKLHKKIDSLFLKSRLDIMMDKVYSYECILKKDSTYKRICYKFIMPNFNQKELRNSKLCLNHRRFFFCKYLLQEYFTNEEGFITLNEERINKDLTIVDHENLKDILTYYFKKTKKY